MPVLAIAYVLAMVAWGDVVTRRFFPVRSLIHRVAAAFLVGLLGTTWITYLAAAAFSGLDRPLVVGNVVFAALVLVTLRNAPGRLRRELGREPLARARRTLEREWRDLVVLAALMLLAAWFAVNTISERDGILDLSFIVYTDFGSTTAIAQSFAVGNNFPTVLPHFPGEAIRYHFLFFFAVGNLTFLGLDPALSMNLLSVLSFGAMLALVMTLGRLLFRAPAVGWIGAALFFFHGSLSWLPHVLSYPSVGAAFEAISARREFLPSVFPYRGETWGIWSMAPFANQRHLASAIGILLLVIIFLVDRWRPATLGIAGWREGVARLRAAAGHGMAGAIRDLGSAEFRPRIAPSFAFAGVLLGAMPMWNGAVFVSAFVLLAVLIFLMPDRRYMLVLAGAAALTALPQLELVRPSGANAGYPAIRWGYVIDDPTVFNVARYAAYTFGPKIMLGLAALAIVPRLHGLLFAAATALVVLTLTVQFSAEMLVNAKFLNIWLILLNLFVAFALWRLWRLRPANRRLIGRAVSAILVVTIVAGGLIDLVPFANAYKFPVAYQNDRLVDWVTRNTEPDDVFLTDVVVTHPILLAGRSVFLGWPYNAVSAGYAVTDREAIYRQLFSETDPQALQRMLRSNDISYVAFDDGIRTSSGWVESPNEQTYSEHFEVVYEDTNHRNIRIYAVP